MIAEVEGDVAAQEIPGGVAAIRRQVLGARGRRRVD